MALQNRVTPLGDIVADSARGTLMGNRGILHDADRKLGRSRWKHKAWIACALAFKGRKRELMASGSYTELFFLDEAAAFAAGHRPCAECRREAFLAWRDAFARGNGLGPAVSAKAIDGCLHAARVESRTRLQKRFEARAADLPGGVFVVVDGEPLLKLSDRLLRWTPGGYDAARAMPPGTVAVATPEPSVRAIAAGYAPDVHGSARQLLQA